MRVKVQGMISYLLFFSLAGISAMFHWKRHSRLAWSMAWLVFVLFIGLRHHVGGDWEGYVLITRHISQLDFLDAIKDQEFLFSALTWVATRLGVGVYGANFVGAVIFCIGLFSYCARQPERWLALATATPFLVIVAVMSANRQGMAIGVVLWVMARWRELDIRRRVIGISIAALFHASAAILLITCVIDLKISKFRKAFLLLFVTVAAFWLMSLSETVWTRYTSIYIHEQTANVYSPGAIFHLLLNLLPAILMLVFHKRWARMSPDWPLLRQLCWIAVALLAVSPYFTVAVSRMSLYLFPISISFLSRLPQTASTGPGRALIRISCVLLLGSVLAAWLAFANTAFTYIPYANVLTIPSAELVLPR